jgi:hypothetical protein
MPGRSTGLRKVLLGGALACLALASAPSSASASFHLTKIREVAGSSSDQAYVELQMYEAGENLISGHHLTFWDQDGLVLGMPVPVGDVTLSGANPPNAQTQRTVLIGDSGVAGRDFTVDFNPFFDQTQGSNLVFAGAVCFENIDCVSWGTFTGAANLPDRSTPFGQPLPVTAALRRSISRGCATLLEASDDTNDNATDFSIQPRSPRPNAAQPTEKSCGGGGNPAGFPNTKIKKRPRNRSDDDSPTFKFKSTEAGSKFKCKLDRKPFKGCHSPKTFHGVDPGKHVFKVKAIDADGNADLTPAKDRFRVLP